jgi:hypothetical protein
MGATPDCGIAMPENNNAGTGPASQGIRAGRESALAGLEAGVRLADHEDLATAAHDLAVAVTGLRGLQGRKDFHATPVGE